MTTELLFSYGTLQLESIQLANFGRTLSGTADVLPGFREAPIPIEDPAIAAELGRSHYTIACYTGNIEDEISGTRYELTTDELQKADAYELPEYRRVSVVLGSGVRTWVYADYRYLPD